MGGKKSNKMVYDNLIKTMVPLNHDRYKTYFTQFLIINTGLVISILTEESLKLGTRVVSILLIVGLFLSIAWLLVLIRVSVEIWNTWHTIRRFEKENNYTLKVSSLERPKGNIAVRLIQWVGQLPAIMVMNIIPIAYFIVFFTLLLE